jgi:peptidoglycan/LPS O-acetylase OafA/YrhL
MVFVFAMLTMSFAGLLMTIVRNIAPSTNVTAALLSAYLVVTSLTTIRPLSRGARSLHFVGLVIVVAVALANVRFAAEVLADRPPDGMPLFPFAMFGSVALLAAAGDVRVVRSGPLRGASRVARHLWRMCFALFIAALSFFIGQADEFPEALRIMPLLGLPVLTVLVAMFYWLWRVRVRGSFRDPQRTDAAGSVLAAPRGLA